MGALDGVKLGILGKGGSGKSTVTVLLARALAASGYEACVVDADPTNQGLASALGVGRPLRSLIDHWGGSFFRGGKVGCPVGDPTPLPRARIALDELPPEYVARTANGISLLVLGKTGAHRAGADCDGPIAKAARDLAIEGPVVTVVDFKAGLEDVARGVVAGLDRAIVVVDPTAASVTMAKELKAMVEQGSAGRLQSVAAVLNRIPGYHTARYLSGQLADARIAPLAGFREDAAVSTAWLEGIPLSSREGNDVALQVIRCLEFALGRASERAA